jgi:GNAT superfamily N-acetyltransferase
MPPVVRPATGADVEDICRVCATGYRFVAGPLLPADLVDEKVAEFYVPDRVAREVDPALLSRRWHGYLVAEVGGVVVGAAGGGMVAEDVGQLFVLYLDLGHRGAGIGSSLLAAVTEQQRALGATRQRVAVLAGNPYGVPFYLARGFHEVARQRYPDGHPDAVPELVLERPVP